jgi:hypothetical protein
VLALGFQGVNSPVLDIPLLDLEEINAPQIQSTICFVWLDLSTEIPFLSLIAIYLEMIFFLLLDLPTLLYQTSWKALVRQTMVNHGKGTCNQRVFNIMVKGTGSCSQQSGL